MTKPESDVRDDFQLCFNAGRYGWSDLFIILDGETLRMQISDVFTDGPGQLIGMASAIISNSSIRLALCDEPGGHILELRADPKLQHTMMLAAYDVSADPPFSVDVTGKKVLEFRAKRQQLLALIMTELWKIQVFMKEPSFQKARSVFPSHELQALNKDWDDDRELGPSFLR